MWSLVLGQGGELTTSQDTADPVLSLQREILPPSRLGTLPPAFSTRVLPAQATEYAFAFIQVPQDVSRAVTPLPLSALGDCGAST